MTWRSASSPGQGQQLLPSEQCFGVAGVLFLLNINSSVSSSSTNLVTTLITSISRRKIKNQRETLHLFYLSALRRFLVSAPRSFAIHCNL